MKAINIIFALYLMIGFSPLAYALEGKLMLSKEQLFDTGPAIDFFGNRGDCESLFYVDAGKNIPDMRRDFRNYFCEGMYTMTLDGPPGTLVTLFGGFDYDKQGGYLVLKKKDDRRLWILHLEEFPGNRWVTSEANKDSGAYEAYYRPSPNFRRNVSSVKWGQWWEGSAPHPVQ